MLKKKKIIKSIIKCKLNRYKSKFQSLPAAVKVGLLSDYRKSVGTIFKNVITYSSVKWSDPGHFLGSQGKFFFVISMYLFFYMFLTFKIQKSFLGRSILHYYNFCNI